MTDREAIRLSAKVQGIELTENQVGSIQEVLADWSIEYLDVFANSDESTEDKFDVVQVYMENALRDLIPGLEDSSYCDLAMDLASAMILASQNTIESIDRTYAIARMLLM